MKILALIQDHTSTVFEQLDVLPKEVTQIPYSLHGCRPVHPESSPVYSIVLTLSRGLLSHEDWCQSQLHNSSDGLGEKRTCLAAPHVFLAISWLHLGYKYVILLFLTIYAQTLILSKPPALYFSCLHLEFPHRNSYCFNCKLTCMQFEFCMNSEKKSKYNLPVLEDFQYTSPVQIRCRIQSCVGGRNHWCGQCIDHL